MKKCIYLNCMAKIGVLDSGIGGFSVVKEIFSEIAGVDILYYLDNANCPYGSKTDDKIYQIVENGIRFLEKFCDIVVIACNTATSVAVKRLREIFNLAIVGTEPAIKLAFGNVCVLATPATNRQANIARLVEEKKDANFIFPDCKELATLVENDFEYLAENIDVCQDDKPFVKAYPNQSKGNNNNFISSQIFLKNILNGHNFDSIVLGCTHYVFLREWIENSFPNAKVVDGNSGVAKRVKNLVKAKNLTYEDGHSLEVVCTNKKESEMVAKKINYIFSDCPCKIKISML